MPVSISKDDGVTKNLLVPAPIVTFSKAYLKRGDGGAIGADYTINLVGQLLDNKGTPVSTGSSPSVAHATGGVYSTQSPDDDPVNGDIDTSNQLTSIMKKQELLRSAFAAGNRMLIEITGYNESKGIKAYCDVENIEFDDQSRWTNRCGYTITLKVVRFTESSASAFSANSTEDSFTWYVSAADESWSIQENDQFHATFTGSSIGDIKRLYTLTHNVSAVGQRVYESGGFADGYSAWQQASGYVHNVIGIGTTNAPSGYLDPLNTMSYLPYNHKFTENIDNNAGSYSVSEEWTLFESGAIPAVEDVSFNVDTDLGGISRLSINGTIQGLAESGSTFENTDKYSNALNYYSTNCSDGQVLLRASGVSGLSCLNSASASKAIGYNPNAGTVTYALTFDERIGTTIGNALTEDIQVSDIYPGQLISITPVIGRSQPIIQYVNSRSEFKKTLQITAQMARNSCSAFHQPSTSDIQSIYNTYVPTSVAVAGKVFYGPPNESWNPSTGQYSYSVEWTYERA
jgi:hypothetical protein